MSYNSLEGMEVVDVLARMKSLHVLNMTGNPLPRKTVDYRRNLLWKCTDITYLDSRPVTDRDRVCLQAWAKVDNILVTQISYRITTPALEYLTSKSKCSSGFVILLKSFE